MSVNKVILVGNVGKDPETRYLEGGSVVSRFPLATSEVYKNREGEKITNTEWHNIVVWRGLAEVAEKYVRKGTQLFIEGRIRNRSYTDKEGNTRYTTDIIADNMQMLGKRSEDSFGSPEASEPRKTEATAEPKAAAPPKESAADQQNDNDVFDQLSNGPDGADDLPF
jgi:single-strand DNA-binding protein